MVHEVVGKVGEQSGFLGAEESLPQLVNRLLELPVRLIVLVRVVAVPDRLHLEPLVVR